MGTQVLSAPWGAPLLMPCGSQKVMHTRKRHSELYHELNQKFHTFDRYRSQSTAKVRAPPYILLFPPVYREWGGRGWIGA